MMNQPNNRAERRALEKATKGGVLLGQQTANHKVRVRNAEGKPLLCCYAPCDKEGDDRYHIDLPHPQPEPGMPNTLRYIFCSPLCKGMYAKGTRYSDRV